MILCTECLRYYRSTRLTSLLHHDPERSCLCSTLVRVLSYSVSHGLADYTLFDWKIMTSENGNIGQSKRPFLDEFLVCVSVL
jgi:hypothetical protein